MKDDINKKVSVVSKINRNELNKYQYTNALISEALSINLLNTNDVISIQNQIVSCLAELIMQKTNGESTSLSAEETKNLMDSIIYTLDIYLENIENPDEAAHKLKTEKVSRLIKKGTKIINDMYDKIMDYYLYIVKNKLKVQLDCYNTTIDEGLPIFLKVYNMMFSAHSASTSIDYPLAIDDWDVRGVKYMYIYMKHLIIENKFCKIFGDEKIEKLLYNFGKKIRMDYKVELINIFELTYHNAIFMLLAGEKVLDLVLTSRNYKVLIKKLEKLNDKQMEVLIRKCAYQLLIELDIQDEEIKNYIFECLPDLIYRLNTNRDNKSLQSMIIEEAEEKEAKRYIFESKESMDESTFRKVINKMKDIYDEEEKADYIIANIKSLYDFIDILNLDYLYENEYYALFSKLSDFELALITKFVHYEDFRDKTQSLYEIINRDDMCDYEWQMYFNEFLKKMDRDIIDQVEKYIDEVDYQQLKFN